MRIKVKQALSAEQPLAGVTVSGWVRTRRDAKDFSFVELNDGSCFKNLQVVVDAAVPGAELLRDALTGSSVSVDGQLVPSPAKGQKWELKATAFRLLGRADETFPLQEEGPHRGVPPLDPAPAGADEPARLHDARAQPHGHGRP